LCGAVLPLVYNDNLLGVLDVQHEAVDFIPDYQLLTLQTLADNLAATLITVRQSLALKTTVRQQEETAQALRIRLQELTSGSRRSAQRTGQRIAGYDLAPDGQLVLSTDMPDSLRAALESGELQVITEGEHRIIRLPVTLRDEQLGVMSFTLPSNKALTERQIEMAKIVANRLALALENKRLADQTRAQIDRERIASGVANRLISATDVDSVLTIAVENFREALGAINSRITVQPFTSSQQEKPAEVGQIAQPQPQPVEDQA
jgi:GAF domain-containing protein